MAYSPDPTDPTQPTTAQLAGNMAYELQALKGYIQGLISSGTNFSYIGGFRNRLKNGGFSIAQRGNVTVTPAQQIYTLDQWLVYTTGDNVVVNQGGAGAGLTANSNYLQLLPGVANTVTQIYNRIESLDCQDMVIGTPVTLSGFYKVDSLTAGFPFTQLFTPTVVDNWAAQTAVTAATGMVINPFIANTWQFFSLTFSLTADATKGLALLFSWSGGAAASRTISFANLQLEKGSYYTPFEYRPFVHQFLECKRFYQTGQLLLATEGTAGVSFNTYTPFIVTPRVVPTIVVVSNTNVNITGFATTVNINGVSSNGSATVTGLTGVNALFTASAEL